MLRYLTLVATLALAPSALALEVTRHGPVAHHVGMCEASGAVDVPGAVGRMIVFNDEDNDVRLYAIGADGNDLGFEKPLVDLYRALKLERKKSGKVDFEGAAWLGGRLYAIGSYSRNDEGELRPARRQLLQFEVEVTSAGVILRERHLPAGLSEALGGPGAPFAPVLALDKSEANPDISAENNGFNIEGLAGSPDGSLMIGLRNPPTPDGFAQVVRVPNAAALFPDMGNPPKAQVEVRTIKGLDRRRGVRSLEWDPHRGVYFLIAGASGTGADFGLYKWSGRETDRAEAVDGYDKALEGVEQFSPEAMFFTADGKQLVLVSDDGEYKGCAAATRTDQKFRSIVLDFKP